MTGAAEWTVLGAGSILPRAGYGSAGHALRRSPGAPVTLFDCGPGTLRQLARSGIGLLEVERVVISHFHPDHWLDLLALAFARHNPVLQPPRPLELLGPEGLGELLDRAAAVFGERSWLRFDRDGGATVTEVEPPSAGAGSARALERPGMRLSFAATGHTPESLAWRADLSGGGSVAYSGDSGESASLAGLARGAALFVCECSFPDEEAVPHHLTPSSAGRLAAEAGCARLVLTHFYPSVDPEDARAKAARIFRGPIEASRDGSVHAIGGG